LIFTAFQHKNIMKLVDVIHEDTILETKKLDGIEHLCRKKVAWAEFIRDELGVMRLNRVILVSHDFNLTAPDTRSILFDGLK